MDKEDTISRSGSSESDEKQQPPFARVSGDSMEGDGIRDGDILVVDKSEEPRDGAIAVCFINGEFTVKRLKISDGCITLLPSNPRYKAITVREGDELTIWGIVRYVIKKV